MGCSNLYARGTDKKMGPASTRAVEAMGCLGCKHKQDNIIGDKLLISLSFLTQPYTHNRLTALCLGPSG